MGLRYRFAETKDYAGDMKMRDWIKAALAVCVAAGMVAGSALVAGQRMPDATNVNEQAVRKLLNDQVEAWNRGDIPGFMKGYWNSENVEFVNTAGVFRGWQNVFDRYMRTYPDKASMGQLTFSELEIHAMCANAAYVVGHWSLDRKSGQIGGVFTLIFRKFPDGWKIINDHTSQSPAATANP
jgi:ketosteroid isomerase-like protein